MSDRKTGSLSAWAAVVLAVALSGCLKPEAVRDDGWAEYVRCLHEKDEAYRAEWEAQRRVASDDFAAVMEESGAREMYDPPGWRNWSAEERKAYDENVTAWLAKWSGSILRAEHEMNAVPMFARMASPGECGR